MMMLKRPSDPRDPAKYVEFWEGASTRLSDWRLNCMLTKRGDWGILGLRDSGIEGLRNFRTEGLAIMIGSRAVAGGLDIPQIADFCRRIE